jgi:hypothetical protein
MVVLQVFVVPIPGMREEGVFVVEVHGIAEECVVQTLIVNRARHATEINVVYNVGIIGVKDLTVAILFALHLEAFV